MSSLTEITLPKLGESIVSATVLHWFKKVGDPVALDEPLLEVSTDKVNSEIPSPVSGILEEICALPDQEVEVGALLARIATREKEPVVIAASASPSPLSAPNPEREDFFSPAVLRLLKEKGIGLDQIDQIPRTGEGGRLTKKDVEAYAASPPTKEETERVKMTPIRKAIAENMVRSFYEAPHASLMTEVDVTALVKRIQEGKQAFLEEHGVKLSITAFVARAIAQAVQAYPLINASLEGDTIVMKRFVNLGVAVSVDQGVMVPVIRGCEQMGLPCIAKAIAQLAEKARTHQLTADEVQGGSLTMTNFGMTGTQIGIPIIRHPEVAIVGLGAITRKVVALADDAIAIRSMLWLSLTFDHRVLDGLYGCAFLSEVKKFLQSSDGH